MVLNLLELTPGFSAYTSTDWETKHVFKEIFGDKCYDIVSLPAQPFIIDAGANIGLFSIYFKMNYPGSTIAAFEPAPENFEALQKNLELYHIKEGVKLYEKGLGDKETEAKLTYYPASPANTTLYPETKVKQIEAAVAVLGQAVADQAYGNIQEVTVPINRLSYFLRTDFPDIQTIDLLKADVEGAELDVLNGLDEEDWPKVQNVIVECTNRPGEVEQLENVLKNRGFHITTTKQDINIEETEKTLKAMGFEVNMVPNGDELYKETVLHLITGRRTPLEAASS